MGLFLALSLLTGVAYPVAMTLFAETCFPFQARGSVIVQDGNSRGSILLGQHFVSSRYFWGRPSNTSPIPYDAWGGTGSNLATTNPRLVSEVAARVAALRPEAGQRVPVDLVTASASGLDPDISPAAALFQVRRVAAARGIPEEQLREIVRAHVTPPDFGILGQPRVNVLRLNLDLDTAAR